MIGLRGDRPALIFVSLRLGCVYYRDDGICCEHILLVYFYVVNWRSLLWFIGAAVVDLSAATL